MTRSTERLSSVRKVRSRSCIGRGLAALGCRCILLDWELLLFRQLTWSRIADALEGYRHECRARFGSMGFFVENTAPARQMAGAGMVATAIPELLATTDYWEAMNLSAAFHIGAGSVKATLRAREKAEQDGGEDTLNRPILAPLAVNYRAKPRDDDPGVPAWLYGIVLGGLDETGARHAQIAKKKPGVRSSGNSR